MRRVILPVARPMSLALPYGAPVENVGDLLAGATFKPYGSDDLRFMSARHTRELLLVTGENWTGAVFENRQRTHMT